MGEVFAGRYELVDPIGRGGVGAVWRAWDHRRRRYVAAKVLLQSDAHSLLRFVREQALRIDHPHVLAPTSWAADDDKVLFTMDLVAGGSLVHLVGDYGPLPPAFVCTLLDQLLSGLAAVHAEDVVHRDVKPANVLLEATGTGRPRLRLSDFGIAMRLGEPRLTETNLVVGTPGYLAPEQMMGAEPDFPADLFAVGLVALYLLEGAKPDSKALIQYFAEHGTPGAPKGIPEPLWQVVATLLQPDPQARFRTATGARKALAAAAELLPEPGPDDELIEIFDQLGPLPPGFAPEGPLERARGLSPGEERSGPVSGGQRPGPASVGQRSGPAPAEVRSGPGTGDARPGPASGEEWPGPASAEVRPGPATGDVRTGPASGEVPSGPGTGGLRSRQDAQAPAGTDSWQRADASGLGNVPAAETAQPGPSQVTGPPATPAQPSSMSDTGSFHLPPPQATVTSSPAPGQPQVQAPRQQAPVSPYDPTYPLHSSQPLPPPYPGAQVYPASQPLPAAAQQRADASTASYTAQSPQSPPPARAASRHRAERPRRRPGPPAKVAVPLLLLALACYAVGFWALTRL
ncbi:serine/threonine-protein kinase [Streptomyces lomondensis]|uniref:non-specific serine/threonine protein kinase n=1 Tax=Streptomyces lomondensis TaxID=68229 RepID=A0ABQ2XH46_9ACTN|nr:serine/threonine-protein kinase [Streptomyces lomondensis]MCF0080442.1 protein kinase [Streptomyces lomondensis]GGX16880.1 serine/threonine protein kinase [Streptomyces lomondensis]